jgi:hypothetical protein
LDEEDLIMEHRSDMDARDYEMAEYRAAAKKEKRRLTQWLIANDPVDGEIY